MSRKSTSIAAALLVSALALPASAAAGTGDPCSPAANAGLKIVDPAGGGSVYATHELTVRALPANDDTTLNSHTASAPGARRLDDPDSGENPAFVRDTPGPLTVSAVVDTKDPSRPADDPYCTANVSTTVELRPALAPRFSLTRPRRGRAGNGDLIYPPSPDFTVTLKHFAGSSRLPITVRARVTRRLRLPGRGAKAASRTYPQRQSDSTDDSERRGPRGCDVYTLICPPRARGGWAKAAEVSVFPIESRRLFGNGLKVVLTAPDGYPAPFRRGQPAREIKTPFGADIELLQGGRRIGRLRVVASCIGGGQSSQCRWRKVSTKR